MYKGEDKMKVELDAPNVGMIEKRYISQCIDSGFISTFGPLVSEFEGRFAKYIGIKRAISVQSGTAALHMALYELQIGPGDEVIIPALTFIATANAVLYVGATPIIVDIDPLTWNIDPESVKEAISSKTKAIMPVHLYGNPCDMDALIKIAKEHNLYVIEDATESLGAVYKGKQTGTFGDFGCFSFNGNKLITTGGGGMIVTDDIKRAEHIKFLINQARDSNRGYYHSEMGFNYRMTNLEAALGLAQLGRIDKFLAKKRKFRRLYKNGLRNISFIRFQEEYNQAQGSWWLNCIKFEKNIDIDYLVKRLKENGIETRRVFVPLSEMPYLRKYAKNIRWAYDIYEKGICLPSSTLNYENGIEYVISILKRVLNEQ